MEVIVKSEIELSNLYQSILSITPDEDVGAMFISGWVDATELTDDDEVEVLFKYCGKVHASDVATESTGIIQIDPRVVGVGDTYDVLVRQMNTKDEYKTISYLFTSNRR